jgi:hypothetical protein
MQMRKGSRGPAETVRLYFIHTVPTGSRYESANAIPTGLSVDFSCASDMEAWCLFKCLFPLGEVTDHSTTNTQLAIMVEFLKTLLKIIGVKCKVAVKFDNELPFPTD